jgi:glycosyltransferase involved in cell wall biosynthesis
VVITTKNEEKNIANCLESIKRQTYPQNRIEIIVVDNNSTDKTKEIARKYTDKVYNKGPERSAQRNYGMIKKAKGKYVMYLDADMILSSTVIEKAVEKLEANYSSGTTNFRHQTSNATLVALYIPEVVLGNSFWSQVRRLERSFYDGTVIDCVRFIRKNVFEKVGGFDISLTGPEDWDLDKKIRQVGRVAVVGGYDFEWINRMLITRIKTADNADKVVKKLVNLTDEPVIFHNEAEFNLQKYLAKKSYYARSFRAYRQKWGKDDPDIKKQFGLFYRYFGVFVENGKWRRLLRYPFLAAGVFLLRLGVGAVYLKERFWGYLRIKDH